MIKTFLLSLVASLLLTFGAGFWIWAEAQKSLPPIQTLSDYKPLLISEVFDRSGQKIAELFKERRRLVPIDQIPKHVIQAFLAAEDGEFYSHKGVNWLAVLRAFWANLRAGDKVQGASTITQQLVKTLFLTPEKTFERKFKELLLAQKLEKNLTKDEILYLYLNQIFFGQNSYGISIAAETYFRKPVHDLTLAEAALLAGLPKAPTKYNPLKNPSRAKERQLYVLRRMVELGFISEALAKETGLLPIKLYFRESFVPQAHGVAEVARQLLKKEIPEDDLLSQGYQVHLTIDLETQRVATEYLQARLKELDKRQGYRGPLSHLPSEADRESFLLTQRDELLQKKSPMRILLPSGEFEKYPTFSKDYSARQGLPDYLKLGDVYQALVLQIDDRLGLIEIQVGEVKGLIDIDSARWARPFDPTVRSYPLSKWSAILKPGDVILAKLMLPSIPTEKVTQWLKRAKTAMKWEQYAYFNLEQEPQVESGLLVIDHRNSEVVAMVGGYDFLRSQFNRVLQARRQTGSAFKVFVYGAALDKGYRPNSVVMDMPLVFENQNQGPLEEWKPSNHGRQFEGEVLLRNALVRSLNIPSVRILEDIGISYATQYVRRLGIFSPLNEDFTLALGSSGVTLYEMTRAFAVLASGGRAQKPLLVQKVMKQGEELTVGHVTLDDWYGEESLKYQVEFENRRQEYLKKVLGQSSSDLEKWSIESVLFFPDESQWIAPQTAYLLTDILKGVIRDPSGTAARYAGELSNVELAGKTGTTNDYVDGWFLGYSPHYAAGVWVGFDEEKTLGPGEVGSRTALPIWIDMMKFLHRKEVEEKKSLAFNVPEGIEFHDVDMESGAISDDRKRRAIRMAFRKADVESVQTSQKFEENVDYLKKEFEE